MFRRWLKYLNESSEELMGKNPNFFHFPKVFGLETLYNCWWGMQVLYHSIEREILHRIVYVSSVA